MNNFVYYSPTKVIFGKGVENDVGEEIKAWGGKRVLVYYGGSSAKKSGLLDRVFASLDAAGIYYVSIGGVQPNPRVTLVNEGVALAKKEGIDFILAVGGGSTIDTAKAAGLAIASGIDDAWDIYSGKTVPDKCLPLASILTISAAGSETSNSSVISNDIGGLKRSFNSNIIRPKFAMMNPELTYTLPKYQIACGVVDIMMHTLERYFSTVEDADLTDAMAEALLRNMIKHGAIAVKEPTNYVSQAEVMLCGSLSHNDLTGLGKVGDFASHQIEHELGGMFDVAHGAGLAAVWGSWARYVSAKIPGKFVQYAERVWNITDADPAKAVEAGIVATEKFFSSIGMPISLAELGLPNITDAQIDELAEKCTFFGKRTIGHYVDLGKEDIIKIYQMAK